MSFIGKVLHRNPQSVDSKGVNTEEPSKKRSKEEMQKDFATNTLPGVLSNPNSVAYFGQSAPPKNDNGSTTSTCSFTA